MPNSPSKTQYHVGLGLPPRRSKPWINVSRLLDLSGCEQHYSFKYTDGRVPRETPVPLEVGKLWHALREATITGQPLPEIPTIEAGAAGDDWDWLRAAWPLWLQQPRQYRPLGCEVRVWLELGSCYLVGTLDGPAIYNGHLVEVQAKTMSPRKQLADEAEWNARSWHSALYVTALRNLSLPQLRELDPTMREIPDTYGCLFDFAVKVAPPSYPVNRTKDGRVTDAHNEAIARYNERVAVWPSQLFQLIPLPLSAEECSEIIHRDLEPWAGRATRFGYGALEPLRSVNNCRDWHHQCCPYNDVCNGGASIADPLRFTDRTPDYQPVTKAATP